MGEITIEAVKLEKTYIDIMKNRNTVFENLSISFERGRLYAIFGPSGSGKTTLLNLLGVLDKPTEGSLKIMGQEISKLSEDQMADIRRDYIGFVFQNHFLNQKLTVKQNLILPLRINKKIKSAEYEKRVKRHLALFGVEEYMNRYPQELSGGEQQRVCIARALMNEPDIILADEIKTT